MMDGYYLTSILWNITVIFTLIATILIGCGSKKKQEEKPAVPTKACNTKSGLLNDDPDLKSDKLMAK